MEGTILDQVIAVNLQLQKRRRWEKRKGKTSLARMKATIMGKTKTKIGMSGRKTKRKRRRKIGIESDDSCFPVGAELSSPV